MHCITPDQSVLSAYCRLSRAWFWLVRLETENNMKQMDTNLVWWLNSRMKQKNKKINTARFSKFGKPLSPLSALFLKPPSTLFVSVEVEYKSARVQSVVCPKLAKHFRLQMSRELWMQTTWSLPVFNCMYNIHCNELQSWVCNAAPEKTSGK